MKKSIISLVLMVCMTLQLICINVGAESTTHQASQEALSAKNFLVKLGTLDETLDVNGVATKSTFVNMILKTTKIDTVLGTEQIFYDVPLDYYAFDEISTAYSVGYIRGNGEGYFYPDKKIHINEALSVVMNALNYGYMIGTASYQNTINKQKLLDGVEINGDGTINNGSCAVLLKNMLLAEYNMLSGTVGELGVYNTDEQVTLLSVLYSITRIEGVVTAVDDIYLEGYEKVARGQLALGDMVIEDQEGIAKDMLGFTVEAFVEEESDEYILFDINKNSKRNEEITFEADILTNKSTAYKIMYLDDSGREKTLDLPRNYTLIYNGRNYNDFDNTIFHITQGKVRVISNASSDYALIYVYEYVNKMIKTVSVNDDKVYFEDGTHIDYSDEEKVILRNADGEDIGEDDLSAKTVATIFASKDGSIQILQLGQGNLIMVPDAIDDEYIYMGEEKVRMTSVVKARISEIKLGKKTIFNLDAFGEITDFELTTAGVLYGWLVGVEPSNEAFDESYNVKIFTENSEMAIFSTGKKLSYNGERKDSVDALSNFKNGTNAYVPQLIKFTTTEDYELKEVWKYTDKSGVSGHSYDKDNFTLDYITTANTSQYRKDSRLIDRKIIADSRTLKFNIPNTQSPDDDDYQVRTGTSLPDGNQKVYQVFDVNEERVASVVVEEVAAISSFTNGEYLQPFIVNEKSYVVNEDGNPVLALTGYTQGKLVRYYVEDETIADTGAWNAAFNEIKINQLECGDIVNFNTSISGDVVTSMRILFRRSKPDAYEEKASDKGVSALTRDYYSWMYTGTSIVNEQYDSSLIVTMNGNETVVPLTASGIVYYLYDSVTNKMYKSTKSEYMVGSRVFFSMRLAALQMVVIYK